ncbi:MULTISPECIES: carbamate kinase [unclassified Gilliamella]|uniref:carbamate kinase n=1 Tax=unclassified Gilliamella TaxID=2685620 RepID=UPI002269CD04|nr:MULTISPECIES: carbamate kinase [unclassified Gilliamella]MCX8602449.1 carbamate kinase [Gilliamella sp. B3722]MCX8608032.1 carbamate kinase [Gilliamella sp. B3771]MCX8611608.1 carbamate kinase [Gilliamella sp. B3891]MCX8614124.1 carbamate kinase [Gilliamella sp. B3773]MCX8618242.1 carbamate kinase [Gilliamella sp. B2923]
MELIVIALGGNAISKRNESLTVENQYRNIHATTKLIAKLAGKYRLVIVHGNGPQVGLLALQNAAYQAVPAYPLDILVAQTQGMLGYMIGQSLQQQETVKQVVTLLTQVEVASDDPAFSNPTKFIGPVYDPKDQQHLQSQYGWTFKADGKAIRRVVPSPKPQKILEIDTIKKLLADDNIVICNGGGGIPVIKQKTGYTGVEAVIDKDHSAAQLAIQLKADHLMILTDADAVYENWGTQAQTALRHVNTERLKPLAIDDGAIGPKVKSVIEFVNNTGNKAYIGNLTDIESLLAGIKGTIVTK